MHFLHSSKSQQAIVQAQHIPHIHLNEAKDIGSDAR